MTNPLLKSWDTPFGLPPFADIKAEHFESAFDEAFACHLREVDAICRQDEAPTFDNTVVALERAGELLSRIANVFYDTASSNTTDEVRDIQSRIAPKMSGHGTSILLNSELFARIDQVFQSRSSFDLSKDQLRLIEETHKKFVRAGANLSADAKREIARLDQEISTLTTKFGQNVLGATNEYELFLKEEEVEGIPEQAKSAATTAAIDKGRAGEYFFNTNRASYMPLLQFADNRDAREKIFNAKGSNASSGAFDNRAIAAEISSLRAERAGILGFKSHADYVLDDRMAKTPDRALGLLKDLWQPATRKAEQEEQDLQACIQRNGGNFKLEAWDWRYYSEKIRAERYDIDAQEVRKYFALDKVRDGAFFVATRLYGLRFDRLEDTPLSHQDCEAWDVKDRDGSHIGVFIGDYFARPSKRDGAWMSTYRDQSNIEDQIRPIVKNTCNFAKPAPGEEALLSFDNVRTLFHEFGHALHGLLSDVTYESQSGTSVKWDFVELPSQIMEHWAMEPEVLKHYARHSETGEIIPDALIAKLKEADTFNEGYETTAYLASSFLDFAWCSLETTDHQDANTLEKKALEDIGLSDKIAPYHRSTSFSHVFSGGYSAGYYSYIWAAVLDCDGFEAFAENGIFDPETATAFRKNVLEKGGTEEPMELYMKFRGREPNVAALLKNRGLD